MIEKSGIFVTQFRIIFPPSTPCPALSVFSLRGNCPASRAIVFLFFHRTNFMNISRHDGIGSSLCRKPFVETWIGRRVFWSQLDLRKSRQPAPPLLPHHTVGTIRVCPSQPYRLLSVHPHVPHRRRMRRGRQAVSLSPSCGGRVAVVFHRPITPLSRLQGLPVTPRAAPGGNTGDGSRAGGCLLGARHRRHHRGSLRFDEEPAPDHRCRPRR